MESRGVREKWVEAWREEKKTSKARWQEWQQEPGARGTVAVADSPLCEMRWKDGPLTVLGRIPSSPDQSAAETPRSCPAEDEFGAAL